MSLIRSAGVLAVLALSLFSSSFARATPGDWFVTAVAGYNNLHGTSYSVESITRTIVTGDVAHYEAVIRLGAGDYDKIGLHRVVRESSPGNPAEADRAIMLLHGDVSSFETSFLLTTFSSYVAPGHALAAYLAAGNIDVWGIDRRWTFLPDAAVDFSSLAAQGFAVAVSDTRIGLGLARRGRYASGSNALRIALGGWSRGGEISYAVANDEAVRPLLQRHVKALLPIDVPIRYAPGDTANRDAVCQSYATSKVQYDAGLYADSTGVLAKQLAQLDATLPLGPSPIFPGFTNHQAVLVLMTQSYLLANPVPHFHFSAGTFDGLGLPTGLQYASFEHTRSWFMNAPGHQSRLETLDGYALVCESPALPFDDNLGLVTVPTFYLGAAGGFGAAGVYSTTLLGSSDVTTSVITLNPGNPLLDFGHADLMYANNAPTLAWQPILTWLLAH